jgi:hypothetical protein
MTAWTRKIEVFSADEPAQCPTTKASADIRKRAEPLRSRRGTPLFRRPVGITALGDFTPRSLWILTARARAMNLVAEVR